MADLLTKEQAAELLGLSPVSVYRLIQSGDLTPTPATKGSRHVLRIARTEVERYAKIQKSQQQTQAPQAYDRIIADWQQAQATGWLTGKPLSPRAIEANTYGLALFWRWLGQTPAFSLITPASLRDALAACPINHEARKCHHTQRDMAYKAVCSLTKYLMAQGLARPDALSALRPLKPRRFYEPTQPVLKSGQLMALLKAAATARPGISSADRALSMALFGLMGLAGLRRTEAIALKPEHIDLASGVITLVETKGQKTRRVGIFPKLGAMLKAYEAHRPKYAATYLAQSSGIPVTRTLIRKRLATLNRMANTSITPHGLRASAATFMSEMGMPVALIQKALGHSDIKTTLRYLRHDEQSVIDWMRGVK